MLKEAIPHTALLQSRSQHNEIFLNLNSLNSLLTVWCVTQGVEANTLVDYTILPRISLQTFHSMVLIWQS